jgi:hypothetical protein
MSGLLHDRLRHGEDATLRAAYRFLYHSGFLALALLAALLLCMLLLDRAAF